MLFTRNDPLLLQVERPSLSVCLLFSRPHNHHKWLLQLLQLLLVVMVMLLLFSDGERFPHWVKKTKKKTVFHLQLQQVSVTFSFFLRTFLTFSRFKTRANPSQPAAPDWFVCVFVLFGWLDHHRIHQSASFEVKKRGGSFFVGGANGDADDDLCWKNLNVEAEGG